MVSIVYIKLYLNKKYQHVIKVHISIDYTYTEHTNKLIEPFTFYELFSQSFLGGAVLSTLIIVRNLSHFYNGGSSKSLEIM